MGNILPGIYGFGSNEFATDSPGYERQAMRIIDASDAGHPVNWDDPAYWTARRGLYDKYGTIDPDELRDKIGYRRK